MHRRLDELRLRAEGLAADALERRDRLRASMPVVDTVLTALEREQASGGTLIAGGLAYRLFFWLVAAGLMAAGIASFWLEEDAVAVAPDSRGLGAVTANAARAAMASSSTARWTIILLGAWLVFYFANRCVSALNVALALAWRAPRRKVRRPFAAALTFSAAAFGCFAAGFAARWLEDRGAIGILPGLLVTAAAYTVLVAWIYVALPHGPSSLAQLAPGLVLVVAGLLAIHVTAVLFMGPRLARSSELYGIFGASTVVLLWLYFIARLLAFGAFLNATIDDRRHDRSADDDRTIQERLDDLAPS